MVKTSIINVKGTDIAITKINSEDYICLTDMVKTEEGEDHIRNWMRNKNTIEFLGLWEQLHNPYFKGVEFDTFLKEAGFNRFNMTPRKWIEATNAIGIVSKSGRNGGTYAHKDIAFEFGAYTGTRPQKSFPTAQHNRQHRQPPLKHQGIKLTKLLLYKLNRRYQK
jgi:hypothetical protein